MGRATIENPVGDSHARRIRKGTAMDYRKISNQEIEIVPGKTPIRAILETMARISAC